jgi:energy-coupling factor transport system permease protein
MTPALQRSNRASFFSRLDFRTKLAVFVAVSAIAALWDDVRLGLGLLLGILALCFAARVPAAQVRIMARAMVPFFILMLLTHGFFNVQLVAALSGRPQLTSLLAIPRGWWVIGGRSLSLEGLLYGVNVLLKSATFLLLIPLCVSTTDINQIVAALVKLRVPYTLSFTRGLPCR